MTSTGSPLAAEGFDFVYEHVKPDIHLASISGGTDIISCFVGGNPNGDITLVEFMDYRCGYCRKAYSEVDELITTDGNIRFVVKEFPILGEASMLSAQFAIALRQLHGDEAYGRAHDALMTLRGEPTPETLSRVATDLGLDPQPILDRMGAPEVQAVIQRTLKEFSHHSIRFDHVSTRRAGHRRFVDLHMHMPAAWTLQRAAALRASVEQALMSAVPGLRATIQLLPMDVEAHFDDPKDPI